MIRETLIVILVPLAFVCYGCIIWLFKQTNKDTDERKFTIIGIMTIILLLSLFEIMFYVSHH